MKKRKIKLVLVTMFDMEGEHPGELGLFLRRDGLKPLHLEGSILNGNLFYRDDGLLAIKAGVGTGNTAVSIMALGMEPELDLSEAYWLVSGIAGGNPVHCSLGSPVWADWCVDGDLAWEIDPREIPEDWSTGLIPLGSKGPFTEGASDSGEFGQRYERFELNRELREWALGATVGVELFAPEEMLKEGQRYTGTLKAGEVPQVAMGGTLSAARFWHGWRMNGWAEQWVAFWSKGAARFFTSGMEDTGTLLALSKLAAVGRVREERVMILRTVSNFTCPPPGVTAAENLIPPSGEVNFPGFQPAVENGHRVASVILGRIMSGEKP